MKRLIFLLLISCFATYAGAQQVRITTGQLSVTQSDQASDEPIEIHWTPVLLQSEEGQAALAEFHRRKDLGLYTGALKGATYTIGETKDFFVRNLRTGTTFDTIEFTLSLEEGRFNVWVETAELNNNHVRPEDIEALRLPLAVETPAGSYDPSKGIIENNETIFGPPSDVDSSGKVDVMVLDIRDDYDPAGGNHNASVGFFDPAHLSGRNMADQVFLDTYPGLVLPGDIRRGPENILQTFAHEYQHLIFSVTSGSGDVTFVDEGLAEWAEVTNGYTARSISYLQAPSEWERTFLDWRDGGGPHQEDYQRSGLFTNYISERIGVLSTGAIARSFGIGAGNYTDVLNTAGIDLKDVMLGFHVANAINDTDVLPEYGYTSSQYSGVRISTIPVIDGTASTSSPNTSADLRAGGVEYRNWDNVADFEIDITSPSTFLRAVLIAVPETGATQAVTHVIGTEPTLLSGNFERVTLILAHADISTTVSALYNYSASWKPMAPSFITHEIVYDDGHISDLVGFRVGDGGMLASRFDVPPGSALSSVAIDIPYEHSFSGTDVPPSAPRDYMMNVWAENQAGLPGDVLFSLEVTDPSQTGIPSGNVDSFIFHTIDLAEHAVVLSSLPSVVFIGVSNAGTDNNYIAATVSDYSSSPTPSYLRFSGATGTWSHFAGVCLNQDCTVTLADQVLPIRATFKQPIDTAVIDGSVLPERVSLEQNYPNPFNPSTAIRYALPASGNVKLSIYDMLGRRVATLQDGFQPSGLHEVRFDAGTFASGLYLYALETGSVKLTRTMMLIK